MASHDRLGPGSPERAKMTFFMQSLLDGRVQPHELKVMGLGNNKVRLSPKGKEGQGTEATLFYPSAIPTGSYEEINACSIGILPVRGDVRLALGRADSSASITIFPSHGKVIMRSEYRVDADRVELFGSQGLATDSIPIPIGRGTFISDDDDQGVALRNTALAFCGISRQQGVLVHLPSDPFFDYFGTRTELNLGTTVEAPKNTALPKPESEDPLLIAMLLNLGLNSIFILGPDPQSQN